MSNLTNCNTTENTLRRGLPSQLLVAFTPLNPVDRRRPGYSLYHLFPGLPDALLYCHNRDTWDTHGGKEVTVEI